MDGGREFSAEGPWNELLDGTEATTGRGATTGGNSVLATAGFGSGRNSGGSDEAGSSESGLCSK